MEIGESQPLKEGIEPNSSSIQERNGKESWANIQGEKTNFYIHDNHVNVDFNGCIDSFIISFNGKWRYY